MAGALALSGYHVPDPIEADETNPAGFHEPTWVVEFHRRCLKRAGVRTLDSDPDVLLQMDRVLQDPDVRREMTEWLSRSLADHGRLVIKDPRLVWLTELWVSVARDLGAEPAFVVMLRHPSEVSSSRTEFYDTAEVTGVAGWLNVALVTERVTSGLPRSFVGYAHLTADWRTELRRVRDELGLVLTPGPEQRPHPVDAFIDPGLRRRAPGWEHVLVPDRLAELSDRALRALETYTVHGDAPDTTTTLDEVRAEYARVHADALAIVRPSIGRVRDEAKRKAVRRLRRTLQEPVQAETTAGGGS